MTIFTDNVHIVSDKSIAELHRFAAFLGIKHHYFHNKRERHHPHYDIPKSMHFIKVIRGGAVRCSTRDLILALRRLKENT